MRILVRSLFKAYRYTQSEIKRERRELERQQKYSQKMRELEGSAIEVGSASLHQVAYAVELR